MCSRTEAETEPLLAVVRRDPRDLTFTRYERQARKAVALIERGKPEEAELLVRRDVTRRHRDAAAYLALAKVLSLREAWGEASTAAVRAAELAWDDPFVVYSAAGTAVYGDLEAGDRLIGRVETLLRQPGEGAKFPFHNELLHLNGNVALRRGDLQRARAMLSLAYKAEPMIVGLGYDLAFSYAQEDRVEEAAAVIADALTYDPDSERLLKLQQQIQQQLEAKN